MSKNYQKKKMTRHHLDAKIRGGKNQRRNTVHIPRYFHEGFHSMFGVMTIEEAIVFLKEVFQPEKHWTSGRLHTLREEIMERNIQ